MKGKSLTIKQILALKGGAVRRLVRVEDGLFVEVQPTGTKSWIFSKMVGGHKIKKNIGSIGNVSYYDARRIRDDLIQQYESQSAKASTPAEKTFAEVAEEWMQVKCMPNTGEKTAYRQQRRLDTYVLPVLGDCECRMITGPQVLGLLREIEAKGYNELTHRIAGLISMILRFGVACGYAEHDVIPDLRGALAPVKVTHFASFYQPDKIGELLRRIDALPPSSIKYALLLCVHTFCRPTEVREATWEEFDFANSEWRIPAERMKMDRPHIVPLSSQVLVILAEAKRRCYGSKYVFPSPYNEQKCICKNAYHAALRRLGYDANALTAHGFRSMASTTLNNYGWPPDAIERQLSHVDSNKVRAAYNRAEFMDVRRRMVQWYSDYLFALMTRTAIPKVEL